MSVPADPPYHSPSNLGTPQTGKAYQVDVTRDDRVKASVNDIVKEFNGRLDVFVANSGVAWTQGPALDGEISHYHKVVSTDLDGTFFCARAAGEHFRRQKFEGVDLFGRKIENFTYGSFIATASMSGHIVNIPQLQAAYNAAKAGVIHLTKSLAVEWVKFARANSVSPGYIATELTDFVPPETKAIWNSKIPMGYAFNDCIAADIVLWLTLVVAGPGNLPSSRALFSSSLPTRPRIVRAWT